MGSVDILFIYLLKCPGRKTVKHAVTCNLHNDLDFQLMNNTLNAPAFNHTPLDKGL